MRVSGSVTFEEYWVDSRFQRKKPNLRGSKKQAFGDNIYSRCQATGSWCQENSHHSLADGTPNPSNIATDTGTNRVLFSNDFVYWGGAGPTIPIKFRNYGKSHINICARRNHKNNFPNEFVNEFIAWIRSVGQSGYAGEPLDWDQTP
jgi:hypothetical protein